VSAPPLDRAAGITIIPPDDNATPPRETENAPAKREASSDPPDPIAEWLEDRLREQLYDMHVRPMLDRLDAMAMKPLYDLEALALKPLYDLADQQYKRILTAAFTIRQGAHPDPDSRNVRAYADRDHQKRHGWTASLPASQPAKARQDERRRKRREKWRRWCLAAAAHSVVQCGKVDRMQMANFSTRGIGPRGVDWRLDQAGLDGVGALRWRESEPLDELEAELKRLADSGELKNL
jgi:hypothetical protein